MAKASNMGKMMLSAAGTPAVTVRVKAADNKKVNTKDFGHVAGKR